jgi:hypothetical protein
MNEPGSLLCSSWAVEKVEIANNYANLPVASEKKFMRNAERLLRHSPGC